MNVVTMAVFRSLDDSAISRYTYQTTVTIVDFIVFDLIPPLAHSGTVTRLGNLHDVARRAKGALLILGTLPWTRWEWSGRSTTTDASDAAPNTSKHFREFVFDARIS